jgi:STE24 endopeptidase
VNTDSTATTLQWLLIVLVIGSWAFDAWLDRLNLKHSALPVPAEFADLYDVEERAKSLRYEEAKYRFGVIDGLVTTLITVAALGFGWAGVLDRFVRSYTDNETFVTIGFFLLLGLLSSLASLPFSAYGTFVIEAKFGFNKTTPATFITDKIKGLLISGVIMGLLVGVIAKLYDALGTNFWFAGWLTFTAFSLVMFAWGTTVITPLFNKLTELPEGELRDAIVAYCQSQGYEIGRLFVMDGSKRSTKANAYFAGMGRAKTIVLFDTLIEKLTVEEVVAVLAHEVGHYKRKHIFSMLYMSLAQTFIIMAMLGFALNFDALSIALGGDTASFHLGAMAFALLLSPLSMLVSMVSMSYSRRNEFDADEFSTSTYAAGQLRSGLAKISTDALSNLNPHPLYVKVHYSHPPMMQRLAALDAAN